MMLSFLTKERVVQNMRRHFDRAARQLGVAVPGRTDRERYLTSLNVLQDVQFPFDADAEAPRMELDSTAPALAPLTARFARECKVTGEVRPVTAARERLIELYRRALELARGFDEDVDGAIRNLVA